MREKFRTEPKIEYREEKHSSVRKIIGSASEEHKGKIKEEMKRRFDNQDSVWEYVPGLKEKEIEKTPEEIEIIKLVNNKTNEFLSKLELEKFNVFTNNVHLFKQKDYQEFLGDGLAEFFPYGQNIFISGTQSRLKFTESCIHEMSHFKSFQTFQAKEKKPAVMRQIGLLIDIKPKKKLFEHLNEAVTEEVTKRIFYSLISQKPKLLEKEIEETERIKKEFLARGNDKNNVDDIYFAQTYPVSINGKKEYTTETEGFHYFQERKILNNLIEKIYLKNKDKFKDKEEVFDLFAKSAFTGKLSWGILIDRTFGKGTFKRLAQLDKNVDELEKFVDNL